MTFGFCLLFFLEDVVNSQDFCCRPHCSLYIAAMLKNAENAKCIMGIAIIQKTIGMVGEAPAIFKNVHSRYTTSAIRGKKTVAAPLIALALQDSL